MNRGAYIYIVTVIIMTIGLTIPLSNFFVSMEKNKISDCRELEGIKDEAYFECLEQNELDTWDMNNENLYLKINFGLLFFVFSIPVLIVSFYTTEFLEEKLK